MTSIVDFEFMVRLYCKDDYHLDEALMQSWHGQLHLQQGRLPRAENIIKNVPQLHKQPQMKIGYCA